ncbi:MAG TPA: hypothetical protein VFC56_16765 [Stellaceae bacterium]|nr:hypothetical protein [Stellaceae bacterium]
MIKTLLTTAAAAAIISGAALAQSPPAMINPAIPPAGPVDSSTTMKSMVAPDGSVHASTTQKSLDADGQVTTEKHSYRDDPAGTEETHSQTRIDPDTGNAVTRTTTSAVPH